MAALTIWVGTFITLCIFSFLYKDNPFYRFAEHLLIGVSAGYYFSTIAFHQVIKPNLLLKLFPASFGTGNAALEKPEYLLIVPGLLGITMLFRLSKDLSWISRFSAAFLWGVTARITIVTPTQEYLIPQVRKAIVPLFIPGNLFLTFSNWILVIGTISSLFYFFFSTEHRGPVFGTVSRIGIYFLMISFGTIFGATIMSRISLLIGRFQFLSGEFIPSLSGNWFAFCSFSFTIGLVCFFLIMLPAKDGQYPKSSKDGTILKGASGGHPEPTKGDRLK